jgi:hypothetical protein
MSRFGHGAARQLGQNVAERPSRERQPWELKGGSEASKRFRKRKKGALWKAATLVPATPQRLFSTEYHGTTKKKGGRYERMLAYASAVKWSSGANPAGAKVAEKPVASIPARSGSSMAGDRDVIPLESR